MCIVTGDPHYITFDGTVITSQGACMYVVSRSNEVVARTAGFATFYVYVRNQKRGSPDDKRASYPNSVILGVAGREFNIDMHQVVTVRRTGMCDYV
jgi:hypothetical protein